MTRTALFLLVSLCVAAASPTSAQDVPLELDRAVADALESSPLLRAAHAGADEAAAGTAGARAARFPHLTLSEGWQRGNQPIYVFSTLLASRQFAADNFAIGKLNHPDAIGAFHATAGVEQLIFDGGARSARTAAADAQVRLASSGVRATTQAVRAQVIEAYGQVLRAQAMHTAAGAALAAGREDLVRATRRRDAGMATDADVLALGVHVADMEQRTIDADSQLAIARAQVNRLSGAQLERRFTAIEPPAPVDEPRPSLAAMFADAEANRPELAKSAAVETVAISELHAARAAFLPHVAAQAVVDVAGTRLTERAASWVVGGEVRWTLGLGGAERAQLSAASAGVRRAHAEADEVRAQIRMDVLTATEQLRSADARRAVGQAAVAQARESQRIVRDRYDAGLVPVNDVLRASTAVLDADTQRVSATVDALTARAHLQRALGRQ